MFSACEGGERTQAGGVVKEGDEVGLAAPTPSAAVSGCSSAHRACVGSRRAVQSSTSCPAIYASDAPR